MDAATPNQAAGRAPVSGHADIRANGMVRVWDPLVRIFHWSLVGLFAFSYLTGDEWERAHVLSGYAIIGLLATRVVWGFIGTRHARFSDFVRSP